MNLQDISKLLDCALLGDGSREVSGVAGMENATPTELTFLANPRYAPKVKDTRAAAILAREPIEGLAIPFLISRDPYLDFARAIALFYEAPRPASGIHPTAVIDRTAVVGEGASIGAYAVVGPRVRIGARAVLHPHVVIYEGARIGDDFLAHAHASVREFCILGHRVVLQNGAVVGGDGFGFARRADGSHLKIPQSGIAVLEDDVEIQCISAVDRASVGETRIRRGAKIDNLVQVGHACEVGEDNIICSQAGLAGTSKLEKNVLLAGQAGISGHLTIHENAVVYAQAGIGGDVPSGALMAGSPAFDAKTWRRAVAAFPQLPEMVKTIRDLKKRLELLEGATGPAAVDASVSPSNEQG